jgi:hypothetical protein
VDSPTSEHSLLCTALFLLLCTALFCLVLLGAACAALYCVPPCCVVLRCTALYCAVLPSAARSLARTVLFELQTMHAAVCRACAVKAQRVGSPR